MAGWVEVGERCAVIPGAVNVGVIRLDGGVLLVDTGLDRDRGRRVVRAVEDAGWGPVVGVLLTHAHADHVGGAAEVVRRTGCPVWATPREAAVATMPDLAPALLFGASAPAAMRDKFMMAPAVAVDHLIDGPSIEICGLTIGVVPLPGHAPGQVALTVDDVCFSADITFPEATLAKHRIPFIYDAADHRRSLAAVRGLPFEHYLPGHGPVLDTDAFRLSLDQNLAVLEEIGSVVLDVLSVALAHGDMETVVILEMGAPSRDLASWSLMATTVRAVLADLADRGLVVATVDHGQLIWELAG